MYIYIYITVFLNYYYANYYYQGFALVLSFCEYTCMSVHVCTCVYVYVYAYLSLPTYLTFNLYNCSGKDIIITFF